MLGRPAAAIHAEMKAHGASQAEIDAVAPHRVAMGERPSNTIMYDRLTPFALGRLISYLWPAGAPEELAAAAVGLTAPKPEDRAPTAAEVASLAQSPPPTVRQAKGDFAPLRVLIPTCRFSTFIRYSSEDLAQAFRDDLATDDAAGGDLRERVAHAFRDFRG